MIISSAKSKVNFWEWRSVAGGSKTNTTAGTKVNNSVMKYLPQENLHCCAEEEHSVKKQTDTKSKQSLELQSLV
jgi:hypothetical protein